MGEGNSIFWCPMFRKTFELPPIIRGQHQSRLLRRNTLYQCLTAMFITLIFLNSRAEAEGPMLYEIDLPAQSVAQSLTDLSVQIDRQLLFPYKLAASIDANPVLGRYTLQQALRIMLRGTGFSGGLTTKGVLMDLCTFSRHNLQALSQYFKLEAEVFLQFWAVEIPAKRNGFRNLWRESDRMAGGRRG